MLRWKKFHLVLSIYSILISTSAFITAVVIFRTPSDPGSVVFLGLSLQRLIMMGGVCFVGIVLTIIAVKTYWDTAWAERLWFSLFGRKFFAQIIRWGAITGLVLSWIVFFIPSYRWGNYQDYYSRIFPIILWAIFVCLITFMVSWIEKYGFHWQGLLTIFGAEKKILWFALISLTIFFLIWILIAVTGMGLWVTDG